MSYKYKTSFSNEILGSERLTSFDKLGISTASLENLKSLIPESIDLEKNIDLMAVAFNAAVVNRFNKNDDGIDTKAALAIKDYFINKPTNIEHKKEVVVGHIVSSSFSSFGENTLLTDEEVINKNSPFNIALGSVVYKTVHPNFANMLEQELDTGEKIISTSWELGFNDYCLALGSKNLDEAEIVTDPKHIQELSQYLKAQDGSGETKDGVPVRRLIVGEIFPLGIAFTSNPAAEVKGVYIEDPDENVIIKDEKESDAMITLSENDEKDFSENENKSSHSSKCDVNPNNDYTLMDNNILEKFEEILSDKLDNKQYTEEVVANVTKVFQEAIMQKDEEYKSAKEAESQALAEAADKNEQLEKDVAELKEQLSSAKAQLDAIEEERAAAEAQELYNSRMAGLDEEFELLDADREILASEIKTLDATEESYASYLEKLRTIWATKSKAYISEQEAALKDRIENEVTKRLAEIEEAKASVETVEATEETDVEEVLEEASEEETAVLTNNNAEASQEEISLRDRFKDAFSKENLTIKL
tara:strand:+ start:14815 stop:16413 length:1599 start_codon:yes stop_codon:yes gene_type:complete